MDEQLFDTLMQKALSHTPSKIAIAVSGGKDSMALLALMHTWSKKKNIALTPLIVNHGLRVNGMHEVLCVQEWVKALGLTPEILHWSCPVPLHFGIMEKARRARYELLALACHRQGIAHLCVAHHLDDVLETVWMRELQGSPWRGLAGISALTFHYGIQIIRPFLGVPQNCLQSTLKEKTMPWVEDPSNSNPLFLRTRARQAIKDLSPQDRLSLIVRTQTYARHRQEEALKLSQSHDVHTYGTFLTIPECHRLKDHSLEHGSLLVHGWVASFSYLTCKRIQLDNLWRTLVSRLSESKGNSPKVLMTGGGCLFVLHKETLYIFRESGRIPEEASSRGQKEWIWDYRFFCYDLDKIAKQTLSCGPWIERHSQSSLPKPWPHPHILFRWCRPAHPHFSAP